MFAKAHEREPSSESPENVVSERFDNFTDVVLLWPDAPWAYTPLV